MTLLTLLYFRFVLDAFVQCICWAAGCDCLNSSSSTEVRVYFETGVSPSPVEVRRVPGFSCQMPGNMISKKTFTLEGKMQKDTYNMSRNPPKLTLSNKPQETLGSKLCFFFFMYQPCLWYVSQDGYTVSFDLERNWWEIFLQTFFLSVDLFWN